MKNCNENIKKVLEKAEELLELAHKGETEREDDGCGVLFGVILDSAYKIKTLAEKEMKKHQESGRWS